MRGYKDIGVVRQEMMITSQYRSTRPSSSPEHLKIQGTSQNAFIFSNQTHSCELEPFTLLKDVDNPLSVTVRDEIFLEAQ
jgi:hypothetical protein